MRGLDWSTCRVGVCVAMLMGTIACGEDEEAAAPVSKPKPAKAVAADTSATTDAAVEAERPFAYSPIGKRDPFRSYLADLQEADQASSPRKTEETERYELDQYRLTGLVTGTSQPRAMVEDPTNRGHVLHIGSHLGKNGGRVTRIAPEYIEVTEEFRAPTGERVRLPIKIKLPTADIQLEGQP